MVCSSKILATAHNADDNLETQIFNLARGCGIEGVCGIPQTRELDGVDGGVTVRPILSATKAEIIKFCDENSIKFVSDSTNLEDDCTRNRIRHRIIPELVSLFGSPQRAALRLSESATADSEFLKVTAQKVLNDADGRIELLKFNDLHTAIKRRVLLLAFDRYTAELGIKAGLESVHISNLEALAVEATPHAAISLSGRIRAVIENGELIFEKDEPDEKATAFDQKLTLGLNMIPGSPYALYIGEDAHPEKIADESRTNIYKLYTSVNIKSDRI